MQSQNAAEQIYEFSSVVEMFPVVVLHMQTKHSDSELQYTHK